MTRPKLLLADDSVTIRKVVELTFADEGIDVTTVADGAEAMSKFIEIQPDIVLVDVGLPGTNGYQLGEMIKGDESTAQIPVLLLVGSFEPFDQDAAERSGADGFLTKPFHSIRDLVNRVHELLGTQQQTGIDNVIDFDTSASTEAENADIDELYERSFAETAPIENYETVPAFGVDDALPGETAARDDDYDEQAPLTMPDAGEAESPPENTAVAAEGPIDAGHHAVDEWLDDEMIDTISSSEPEEIEQAEASAVEAVSQYEQAPAAAVDVEPVKEFDWSPEAIVTGADADEIASDAGYLPTAFGEDVVTEEMRGLDTEQIAYEAKESNGASSSFAEPSPELIDLIVHRVLERLSDRAVREVAQEAVPRIAEKLMREALDEDRNR